MINTVILTCCISIACYFIYTQGNASPFMMKMNFLVVSCTEVWSFHCELWNHNTHYALVDVSELKRCGPFKTRWVESQEVKCQRQARQNSTSRRRRAFMVLFLGTRSHRPTTSPQHRWDPSRPYTRFRSAFSARRMKVGAGGEGDSPSNGLPLLPQWPD